MESRRELKEAGDRLCEAERIEWGEEPSLGLARLVRDVWRQLQ